MPQNDPQQHGSDLALALSHAPQFHMLVMRLSAETGVETGKLRKWFDNRKQKYRRLQKAVDGRNNQTAGLTNPEGPMSVKTDAQQQLNGRQAMVPCQQQWWASKTRTGNRIPLDQRRGSGEAGAQFKCEWPNCSYIALRRSHLIQHVVTHTGERPFGTPLPLLPCTTNLPLLHH